MTQKQVSLEAALGAGWQGLKGNLSLVGAVIAFWAISQGPSVLLNGAQTFMSGTMKEGGESAALGMGLLFMGLGVVSWFWTTFATNFIHPGWNKICLNVIDGNGVQIGDLFSCLSLWWKFFAASCLYSVMVGVGTMLLIAPGVFLGIAFGFYRYYIVEDGMGPIQALEASWNLTDGARMQLLVLALACFGIAVGGALCLLVGIVPAFIVNELAWTSAYRSLRTMPAGPR